MSRSVICLALAVVLGCVAAIGASAPPAYAVQESLWQPMSIAGDPGGTSQIDFVNQDVGWAEAPSGAVARTTDGGLSWSIVRSGDGSSLGDVAAVSADCAWIATRRFVWLNYEWDVLRTTDGGLNWQTVATGTGLSREIEALDADHAFVATGDAVHATVDGGATWTVSAAPSEVVDICFVDAQHGWARAGYLENTEATADVWRTTDGGSTWTELTDLPSSYGYSDVEFVDAGHGYLVSSYVTATTSDGGETWTPVLPIDLRDARLYAVDTSRVWAVSGHSSVIRATDDGGATWVTQPAPPGLRGDYELAVVGDMAWIAGSSHFRTERSGYSDLRPPVTGHDCPTHVRSSVQVSLSPTDEGSGVAETWFKVGSGQWQEGLGFTLDVPPGAANGTRYEIELSSSDLYGNWETGNRFSVIVDTYAPQVEMTGGWSRLDEWTNANGNTVTVSGWDSLGGSGISHVDLCLDHGRWTQREPYLTVEIPGPLDHSNDGIHTVAARSVDAVGNLGEAEVHWVGVDTRRPRARAPYVAHAYSRGLGAIVFRIDDTLPCSGYCQATLTIKTLAGKKLAVMEARDLEVNRWYVAQFYCPLKPGKYRFSVKGVDWSGNSTAKQASNYLVVKAKTSGETVRRKASEPWLTWEPVKD